MTSQAAFQEENNNDGGSCNSSNRRTSNRSSLVSTNSTDSAIRWDLQEEADRQAATPDAPSAETGGTSSNSSSTPSSNVVPTDQERQILLLMLLGQVCAMHDPTPRTFTAHVLELFERGLLDRRSIGFLYELGLVPPSIRSSSQNNTPLLLPAPPTDNSLNNELAIVPSGSHLAASRERSAEASAIRNSLERQELQHLEQRQKKQQKQQQQSSSPSPTSLRAPLLHSSSSFAAEHHPLSLSRYQREFIPRKLLSKGAFGHVYQATNKMDGRDYAVKRVPFNAIGYSRDSLQQVLREVQCLAVCDHQHVVRYYTSWLEPSWMTGTTTASAPLITHGAAATADVKNGVLVLPPAKQQQKLLTNAAHHPQHYSNLSEDGLEELFKMTSLPSRRRRHVSATSMADDDDDVDDDDLSASSLVSFDSSYDDDDDDSGDDEDDDDYHHHQRHHHGDDTNDCSAFATSTLAAEHSVDDSVLYCRESRRRRRRSSRTNKKQQNRKYQYQICLFIQQQLCKPTTLADWIRERNETEMNCKNNSNSSSGRSVADRLDAVAVIFSQVASGLAHVHESGIIHRDLKPGNVFEDSYEGGNSLHFKIGDFGLSKLIKCATSGDNNNHNVQKRQQPGQQQQQPRMMSEFKLGDVWHDPLTAGVGTASYAAPEQVTTRTYGKEADIFSLGLMLLELMSCFSTEHERMQTFHDCRHRRKLPDELNEFPAVARLILACTEPNAQKRPTAAELVKVSLFKDEGSECEEEDVACLDSRRLLEKLAEKDRLLEEFKKELAEKQRLIDELRRDVQRLTNKTNSINEGSPSKTLRLKRKPSYESDNELSQEASASSSSSEDEL